jgi:trehalose 6-phosphate phosphatase
VDLDAALVRFGPPGPAAVIACDYDGTLAPIVADPEAAVALPAALDALGALRARGAHVVVISGRPVAFLLGVLAHAADAVDLVVGQYGLEWADDDGVRTDPRTEPYVGAIAAAASELERDFGDFDIERKGTTAVTVHWRVMGGIADPQLAAIDALARRFGLVIHPTRMARELRPPIGVDKGDAMATVLARYGARAGAFIGDDSGDLAAWDALDAAGLERSLRVGVLSSEAPPAIVERADVLVDGPTGVAELLTALAGYGAGGAERARPARGG